MYTNAQVQLEMLFTNTDRSTNGNVHKYRQEYGQKWPLMGFDDSMYKATDEYKYKMNTIADTQDTQDTQIHALVP